MPTPEERRRIFEEVQARSRAAKEKRKKGMAATVSDVKERAMEPETPVAAKKPVAKKKMKPGISFIDMLRRRKHKTEEALKM